MRRIFVPLLGIALLTVPVTGYSSPWGWLVQKTTGKAIYSSNGTAEVAVQKGLLFDRGTVHTGDNGRVLLVRNEETVFIGPFTVASIAAPSKGLKTTVTLQRGQASFSVRKKLQKHFSVDTPFMAAVVKGTKFDVTVGASSAQVSVTEGVVEVRALKSGQVAQLLAGQRAVVNDGGKLEVTGKGKLVKRGAPVPARSGKSGKGKSGKGGSGKGGSGSGSSGSGSSGGDDAGGDDAGGDDD